MSRDIKTLLFSTLYPSSARPGHGIFVETRLRELLREGGVRTKVIAPVPWFPWTDPRWGHYANLARTPRRETRNGVDVLHPRYAVIPKLGMTLAPMTLAAAGLRAARQLQTEGYDFDIVDAHYFYPDGVAAAWVAHVLRKPLVITARGSDINLIASHALPRQMMLWAARRAGGCIGVSKALVDNMRALGMPAERLQSWPNGVDIERFLPLPRAQARQQIGHDGQPLLLAVGNLVPLKGHDLCIDALAQLLPRYPQACLLIAGVGPERERLIERARASGVAPHVHLVGAVPNADLHRWYSAADLLLLPSSREGWPNVLLESLACGTPVVASRVGGIPEIVTDDRFGRLLADRDAASIATSVTDLLDHPRDRDDMRRHAKNHGWRRTSRCQQRLFAQLAAGPG